MNPTANQSTATNSAATTIRTIQRSMLVASRLFAHARTFAEEHTEQRYRAPAMALHGAWVCYRPQKQSASRAPVGEARPAYSRLLVMRSISAIEVAPSRTFCRPSSRSRRMPSWRATATMSSTEARSRISARIGSETVMTS